MTKFSSLTFPKRFLWGASTAAHQVEGNNRNDWTEWEIQNAARLAYEAEGKFKNKVPYWNKIRAEATDPGNYISGSAVDHYSRFREDIGIMRDLGFNAYSFSIEWSRIQPERGVIKQAEVGHYREVIKELRQNGMEPFVRLWHRTNPLWISQVGGWENKRTVEDFLGYAEAVVRELGSEVNFWMTLNEPTFFVIGGYVYGQYPPGVISLKRANRVFLNLLEAHRGAYGIIHRHCPNAKVGIPHAIQYMEPRLYTLRNRLAVKILDYQLNRRLLSQIADTFDFIGVQFYKREVIDVKLKKCKVYLEDVPRAWVTDMGWEIFPEGIYQVLMAASKYGKPLYVTENGLADSEDQHRARFIAEYLRWTARAIADGADVRGYFYWSLLDNTEWDKGFWPKFGLIKVDRRTMERIVRPSAYEYAKIIKEAN